MPKDAESRIDRRPRAEDWFYIWGEIEQGVRAGAGLSGVGISDDPPGARRGGYSIDNSLLIHADIGREVNRQYGQHGLRLVALLYVEGWEWEEEIEVTRWKDGTTSERPTGRYYRKHFEGYLKAWQLREIASIVKHVGDALGLK